MLQSHAVYGARWSCELRTAAKSIHPLQDWLQVHERSECHRRRAVLAARRLPRVARRPLARCPVARRVRSVCAVYSRLLSGVGAQRASDHRLVRHNHRRCGEPHTQRRAAGRGASIQAEQRPLREQVRAEGGGLHCSLAGQTTPRASYTRTRMTTDASADPDGIGGQRGWSCAMNVHGEAHTQDGARMRKRPTVSSVCAR